MRLTLTLVLLVIAGVAIAAPRPTNVLFILTDNQPASILGAYGNSDVRTPNIDRLAREGIRFTGALRPTACVHPPGRP